MLRLPAALAEALCLIGVGIESEARLIATENSQANGRPPVGDQPTLKAQRGADWAELINQRSR